ncbi:MAG: site-specific integrase, partial [Hyphomicrobiaceae bacterium]|nr:site-specific integrase [Hyphomicrobiaceae bacterium]
EINDRVVRQAFESGAEAPPSAPLQEKQTPHSLMLTLAIERFLREHGPTIREKTRLEYDQTFRLAVDFWGGDHFVGGIDKARARDFKALLLKLPTNMTQRFPGKTLQEAVDEGEKIDLPTISSKTINKKISNVSTLFNWLKDQGYVQENPFSGLTVKELSGRRRRDPFNPDQLRRLFSQGVFANGHVSQANRASLQDLENFWIPLIGLFTGMRLGEIAQLDAVDIRQVQDVWIFDIHDRADHHLKTCASNRQVPVHQSLIDMGLLDYREALMSDGNQRLFPAMEKASDGFESSAFSKRFSRYLTKSGVKTDRRLTFHSFRHTMKDMMREAGIDRSVQDAICGHDDGSVQANYGRGYSANALYKQLHRINPPVDLSKLSATSA